MKHKRLTPAFSMLELIFVIVILGIVASIGSEMIAKVYESYIVQRAEHRATLKTELAATQIANRLASAIPGTVYRKRRNSVGGEDWIEGITNYLGHPTESDQYNVLQWVASDSDSFNAATIPGWSGFCDIDISSQHIINTPGSNLTFVPTIQTNFGYTNKFAIYFPYDNTPYYGNVVNNIRISLDNNASHIVEHYKLARTSYALVTEDNGEGGRDLYLYYNFIPTPAIIIPTNGPKSLLMKNISTFKFQGAGRTIRFKICKQENIGEDFNITACKEKAVF